MLGREPVGRLCPHKVTPQASLYLFPPGFQSVSVFMVRAFHTVVLDISSEMLISEGSALQGIFHTIFREDGSEPTKSIQSNRRAWKSRAQLLRNFGNQALETQSWCFSL